MNQVSPLEELFLIHAEAYELPEAEREYRFHPIRNWTFDFAWLEYKIAMEIEGGLGQVRGRHARIAGYSEDCVKYNEAQRLGWKVFRFTSPQVTDTSAALYMKLVLEYRITGEKKYLDMLNEFYRNSKQVNWPVEIM